MTARKTADAVPSEIPKAANVYQRLAIAKKLVAAHTFTKVKGEGLKFAYLPIDQVKPIVEDAMNEAGLVLLHGPVDTYDVRPSWVSQGQYGGSTTWFHLGGSQTFTWVNIDDPEDTIKVTFYGEARDNSDKTLSKLYTAILKNFYKATFNISDSPKDDTDITEDEVRAERGVCPALDEKRLHVLAEERDVPERFAGVRHARQERAGEQLRELAVAVARGGAVRVERDADAEESRGENATDESRPARMRSAGPVARSAAGIGGRRIRARICGLCVHGARAVRGRRNGGGARCPMLNAEC